MKLTLPATSSVATTFEITRGMGPAAAANMGRAYGALPWGLTIMRPFEPCIST